MTEFQKIAIGLLGLTHPEILMGKGGVGGKSTTRIGHANGRKPGRSGAPRDGRLARAAKALRFALAALSIGSRTVGLADNTQLRRDLRAYAGLLYGDAREEP
jgi:hypothetical protein